MSAASSFSPNSSQELIDYMLHVNKLAYNRTPSLVHFVLYLIFLQRAWGDTKHLEQGQELLTKMEPADNSDT